MHSRPPLPPSRLAELKITSPASQFTKLHIHFFTDDPVQRYVSEVSSLCYIHICSVEFMIRVAGDTTQVREHNRDGSPASPARNLGVNRFASVVMITGPTSNVALGF